MRYARLLTVIFALAVSMAFSGPARSADEEPLILFQIVFENTAWTDEFYSYIIDKNGLAYEVRERGGNPIQVGSVDPEEFKYMKTLRIPASKGYFKEEENDRLDMNVLTYYCYMSDPMQEQPVRILLRKQAKRDTVNVTPAADELVKWISLQHYKMTRQDNKSAPPGGGK